MKTIKQYIKSIMVVLVVGISMFFTACDQLTDPLNEDPRGFSSPETFYTNPEQIEAAFASSMNAIHRYWGGYGWAMRPHFHITDSHHGGFNITPNWASGLWGDHYRAIAQLNFAIKSMNEGKLEGVPQSQLDELMGQARFLRAHNYFQLVRMFGPLPLMTDSQPENYYSDEPERSSIAEVYNLITSDFAFAAENLPPQWSGDRLGRPSSGAARALLAKAHLTMATAPLNDESNYQQAANHARQVIDSGLFELVEDVDQVFSYETEFGPEMMWSYVSNQEYIGTHPQTWSHQDGWGDHSVDQVWLDRYPDQPRKSAYIALYNYDGIHHEETGHRAGLAKYRYGTEEEMRASRSYVNMSVIRYADVLLIFAEAENRVNGGPTQAAVDAMNQVIDRANGYVENPEHPRVDAGMTMQEFEERVIRERDLELCFEYDRWYDIVRHRLYPEALREEYRANFSPENYLFPIPNQDLRQNENLTQNPGYPHPAQ